MYKDDSDEEEIIPSEPCNAEIKAFADKIGAQVISFHSIEDAANICRNRKKYVLFLDKKGQCESYFQYKGKLRQLHAEHMKVQMLGISKAEVCETMRRGLVSSMELGGTFVISLGKLPFSFAKEPKEPYDEAVEKYRYFDVMTFDTEKIFDFNEWRNWDNYTGIVKEDEKKTLSGEQGPYMMQPSFTICLLANYSTEQQMMELVNNGVPKCADNFEIKIVV